MPTPKFIKQIEDEANDPCVSAYEASEMLGLDRNTITVWIKAGRFPHSRRFGKYCRIPIRDIEALKDEYRSAVATAGE